MGREDRFPRSTYWNVWWTLTVITAAATLLVLILEALGVFRDLGLVLRLAGILLSIVFGMSASTRSALATVRDEMGAVRDEITALRVPLDRILAILIERLPPASSG
jgi:hypothetical protein